MITILDPSRFVTNFPGDFHDLSVIIWRAYEFNNLLLSPPKFRRTLIVYFQLIMQFLQKLILMSQPPKQSAVGSWENSSEMLNSWNGFRRMSSWAAAYNSFFCWDCAAFFCQNGRAGTFKFKIDKQKKRRQRRKKGLCLCASLFLFWVTLLQDFMYIGQVPLPASCAYFLVKCGSSHPEGSIHGE